MAPSLINEPPPRYTPVDPNALALFLQDTSEVRSPVLQKALCLLDYALADKDCTKFQRYIILDAVLLVPTCSEALNYLRDIKRCYDADHEEWNAFKRHLENHRVLHTAESILYGDAVRRYSLNFDGLPKLILDLQKLLKDGCPVLLNNYFFGHDRQHLRDAVRVHDIEDIGRRGRRSFREEMNRRLSYSVWCWRGHAKEIVMKTYDMQVASYVNWDEEALLEKFSSIADKLLVIDDGADNTVHSQCGGLSRLWTWLLR